MATPIKHAPRATLADTLAYVQSTGPKRPQDVVGYLTELWRLATKVGYDPLCLFGQACFETAIDGKPFQSDLWNQYLNPAGIGQTDSGPRDRLQTDDPKVAARVHVVHLGGYIEGPDGGWLKDTVYKALDPRWKYLGPQTFSTVTNVEDLGGGLWASTATPKSQYSGGVLGYMAKVTTHAAPSRALVFGKVPFPGYVDHQALTANKPEGVGWDDIGLWGDSHRTPMFVVIHRMYGTMAGTDSPDWFGSPTVKALTDYGIATGNIDGPDLDGVIVQWNDPRGRRVPWASGPVEAPYGDGLRWLNWSGNTWGPSICNACGVSVENSGKWDDPMTDFAFGELAKFVAYWFDQFGVAWDKAPIHPKTGISAICWHQEFTIGSGKVCPGNWLMDNTQRLIDAAAAIMKPYQTGTKG